MTIRNYLYEPASITVPKGTTVTFTKVTLEEAGTFAYYCLFHPFMKGTIVVT